MFPIEFVSDYYDFLSVYWMVSGLDVILYLLMFFVWSLVLFRIFLARNKNINIKDTEEEPIVVVSMVLLIFLWWIMIPSLVVYLISKYLVRLIYTEESGKSSKT